MYDPGAYGICDIVRAASKMIIVVGPQGGLQRTLQEHEHDEEQDLTESETIGSGDGASVFGLCLSFSSVLPAMAFLSTHCMRYHPSRCPSSPLQGY